MKVMIVDIGNTHIHSLVFDQDGFQLHKVYSTLSETPRADPKELLEAVRREVYLATDDIKVDGIMVNSFSGAFIYADRFFFADKDVPEYTPEPDGTHELYYGVTGQNNRYGLVGFPSLLAAMDVSSERPPLSPHQWVVAQLREKYTGNAHTWDITHASRSGIYNLRARRWCELDDVLSENRAARQILRCPVLPPGDEVGSIRDIPLFSGGLDHSFVSCYHSDAYIASGTWTNVVQVEPRFYPWGFEGTSIRWGIVADGRYAKEIVFRSVARDLNDCVWLEDSIGLMNFRTSVAYTGRKLKSIEDKLGKYNLSYGMDTQDDLEQKAAAYFLCRTLHDRRMA